MAHVVDHSPLADCTSAVENEDNIYNSSLCVHGHKLSLSSSSPLSLNVKSLLQQRGENSTASTSNKMYTLSSHTPDATPVRTSCTNEEDTTSPGMLPTTPIGSRRRLLDDDEETPTVTKKFVSCTPEKVYTPPPHGRHDPYGPCVFESTVSAEISFVACYSETSTPLKDSCALNDTNTYTPAHTHMPAKAESADVMLTTPLSKTSPRALLSSRPPPLQSLQKMNSGSRCPQSPVLSNSMTISPLSALKLTTPLCFSPAVTRPKSGPTYRTSGSQSQSQSRVVKTVVQCGIDRSSGRPVPKPKLDA